MVNISGLSTSEAYKWSLLSWILFGFWFPFARWTDSSSSWDGGGLLQVVGCGLVHQLLTLFHAKQDAKVGSVASSLHGEGQSKQGSTTPYGAGSTQPGTDCPISHQLHSTSTRAGAPASCSPLAVTKLPVGKWLSALPWQDFSGYWGQLSCMRHCPACQCINMIGRTGWSQAKAAKEIILCVCPSQYNWNHLIHYRNIALDLSISCFSLIQQQI